MRLSKFLIVSFVLFGLGAGLSTVSAAEEDKGLVVIDRKPWKTSWIEKSNKWVLLVHFDKGELRTHFNKPPPVKGLGIELENKPSKQEFKYYPSGKTYSSKNSQFEQWPDGAKAWVFVYEDIDIVVEKIKFINCITAIIQEAEGAQDEIRYSFFKRF